MIEFGNGAARCAARSAHECELLHVRPGIDLLCWRGHRAIGDDGRCPTIARLGVSSLDLASPAPTGGALFAAPSNSTHRVESFSLRHGPAWPARATWQW